MVVSVRVRVGVLAPGGVHAPGGGTGGRVFSRLLHRYVVTSRCGAEEEKKKNFFIRERIRDLLETSQKHCFFFFFSFLPEFFPIPRLRESVYITTFGPSDLLLLFFYWGGGKGGKPEKMEEWLAEEATDREITNGMDQPTMPK